MAKRVRPEILTAVSYLCGRVNNPTVKDNNKLSKIFQYLRGTTNYGILYTYASEITPTVYVDAAYLVHEDTKSRTGIVIKIGNGIIEAHSRKQKIVTRSSTEAELVALADAAALAMKVRNFLSHQGHEMKPIQIYEDNKSVISMIQQGKSTNNRTKHIKSKYYFVKQYILSNELAVTWCPTEDMIADLLTKPVVGGRFYKLRKKLVSIL